MVYPVGYRFRPTDEELINHYLRRKILFSNTNDVDQVINTVDICRFDPWDLPSQSRTESRDLVWYVFGRKDNKYNRGDKQSRRTSSGFWKKTGKTMEIIRKKGGNREKIGEKKVLVFMLHDKSKTKWVMHEYHATFLSPNQKMIMTYTICKVKFNGEEREISSSTSGGQVENPRQFSGFLDVEQEIQLEDAMRRAINNLSSEEWKSLIDDDEQVNIVHMQEDRNDYRPQKSLTGVCVCDDSDSDSISITANSIEISSTGDSFGSSNYRVDQTKVRQESPNSTIELVPITQVVSQALGQGTEVEENELGQEKIKKKKAGFFYKMIQRFVKKVHLCSFVSRT